MKSLVVFALAALDAVSASLVERAQFKTEDVWNRPQGDANQVADLCHSNAGKNTIWAIPNKNSTKSTDSPEKKYVLPCLAEQFISKECEELTGYAVTKENSTMAQLKALKECFTGPNSSYFEEVKNCMHCKKHYKYFSDVQYEWYKEKWELGMNTYTSEKDKDLVGTPWMYTDAQVLCGDCVAKNGTTIGGWSCFTELVANKNFTEVERKAFGKPHYNQTTAQNIGTFKYKGQKYTKPAKRTQKRSGGPSLSKVMDIARCDNVESTNENIRSQCRGANIFVQKSGKGFISTTVVEDKILDFDSDDFAINSLEEVPDQFAESILSFMETATEDTSEE